MEQSLLLRMQSKHRSSNISDEVLKCKHLHIHTPERFMNSELRDTGFHYYSCIGPFRIDPALTTALVERWRPETNTFHLPTGECTITLEDVALQLGLPVNGLPVTGPTYFDWADICQELLGKVPEENDMRGCQLKLKWLMDNFYKTAPPATQVEREQYCRAHILNLIGSSLMPDKSNSRVHLMYLPLLRDLRHVRKYSWGAACLGHLYKELSHASMSGAKTIGGCLMLLQSWVWYRLPMLAPCGAPSIFPCASRWSLLAWNFRGIPHGNLPAIRARLDHMNPNEFDWRPYPYDVNIDQLPEFTTKHSPMWKACVPLICFSTVEWHQTDRVKLQFGLIQEIPQSPMNMDDIHAIDKRGNHDVNWASRHADWINMWEDRYNRLVEGHTIRGIPIHTNEYMQWYHNYCRPYLSMDQQLNDPRLNTPNVRQDPSFLQVQSSHPNIDTPGAQHVFGVLGGTPEPANEEILGISPHQQLNDTPGTSSTMQGLVSQEPEQLREVRPRRRRPSRRYTNPGDHQ